MLINSPFFLFVFLPIVLVVAWLVGRRLRYAWLLLASFFFYAWSQPLYLPVILLSTLVNYAFGIWISRYRERKEKARSFLTAAVVFNLALLGFFKILVTYWPQISTMAGGAAHSLTQWVALPLGISFFTFAALSYVFDVYIDVCPGEARLDRFALFIFLFPKVIAGPIVRYRDFAKGEKAGYLLGDIDSVAVGVRRFVIGMAKKVLIADRLAMVTDQGVFNQALPNLTTPQSWLLLLCYALQIYYDFSGYSDMAIGLGRMLGFQFVENFNDPYLAISVADFWRRWHISLSSWFRDYLFYPLERRRRGAKGLAPYLNILLVFLATGLWHGVTLNFVIWGLIHGLAICFETSPAGKALKKLPVALRRLYALIVILLAWVFFRSTSLGYAFGWLGALTGLRQGSGIMPFSMFPPVQPLTWIAIVLGLIFATPIAPWLSKQLEGKATWLGWVRDGALLALFIFTLVVLAGSSYSPYIYGNF